MTVEVRPVGLEAVDLLAELHRQCFDDGWDRDAFARLLGQPQTWAFCAQRDDLPVGFVLLRGAADQGEILSIGVTPRSRGAGIGGRLMEAAFDCLEQHGAVSAFLEVADDNRAGRALYARLGFAECGRRPGYYTRAGGRKADALVLSRPVR